MSLATLAGVLPPTFLCPPAKLEDSDNFGYFVGGSNFKRVYESTGFVSPLRRQICLNPVRHLTFERLLGGLRSPASLAPSRVRYARPHSPPVKLIQTNLATRGGPNLLA